MQRKIPYVFTLRWILRNLTEDHGRGEGKKKGYRGRQPKHKRLLKTENRGAWVAQSVERLTSAQVMISQSVGSSPVSGSVLTAQSLEPASDSVSSSLSAPLPLMICLSKINKH